MTVRRSVLLAALAFAAATTIVDAQEIARLPTEPDAAVPMWRPADATATMRALLADPTLWANSGLAENAYDFNAPSSIPGFGPMEPSDRRVAKAQ